MFRKWKICYDEKMIFLVSSTRVFIFIQFMKDPVYRKITNLEGSKRKYMTSEFSFSYLVRAATELLQAHNMYSEKG